MEPNQPHKETSQSQPPLPPAAAKALVEILAHGLGAMERRCLEQGVPVQELISVLLNHVASLVAVVSPPGMRAIVAQDIIDSVPNLVREHVSARQRTPGGVFLPLGTMRRDASA